MRIFLSSFGAYFSGQVIAIPDLIAFYLWLAVADLDADGHLDLAIMTGGNVPGLWVYRGDGLGAFAEAGHLLDPWVKPGDVEVADVNEDGNLDVAVLRAPSVSAGTEPRKIQVFLGDRLATPVADWVPVWSVEYEAETGRSPFLAFADLTGDGRLDLVRHETEEAPAVAVHAGKGDGTFAPAIFHPTTTKGYFLSGDFDGDGQADLVVAEYFIFEVLLSSQDYEARAANLYLNPASPFHAADFDRDGHLDLLASDGEAALSLIRGRGDGTFENPVVRFGECGQDGRAAFGDFDGDAMIDIAAFKDHDPQPYFSYDLGPCILLGESRAPDAPVFAVRHSSPRSEIPIAEAPYAGDFDGDGRLDVAHGLGEGFVTQYPPSLRAGFAIDFGNGDGTLREPVVIAAPEAAIPWPMAYSLTRGGDLNRDGIADVVAMLAGEGLVYVSFLGRGDGTFALAWSGDGDCCGEDFVLADLDADEKQDIVAFWWENQPVPPHDLVPGVWVLRGRGDGTFEAPVRLLGAAPFPGGMRGHAFDAADLNGDERTDLVLNWWWRDEEFPLDRVLDRVLVLFNLGEGLFSDPVIAYETMTTEPNIHMVEVADVNADGHQDIALYEDRAGGQNGSTMEALLVVHGNGRGGFRAPVEIALRPMAEVLVRDLNGDGLADFTLTGGGWLSSGVEVVLGQGTSPPGHFHRGDSNDDGRADLADAVFTLSYLFASGRQPTCLEAANANDDQRLDISDGIHLLQALFLGGPRPPAPGLPPAPCGLDPAGSPADLGCDAYTNC